MSVIDRETQFSDLTASDIEVCRLLYYSRFYYSDLLEHGELSSSQG